MKCAPSASNRAKCGVTQLTIFASAAEKQAAPAHVTAAGEIQTIEEAIPEDFQQGSDILGSGNASQKDHAGSLRKRTANQLGIANERIAIMRIVRMNRRFRRGAQPIQTGEILRRQQSARRSDDADTGDAEWRASELRSVSQFAAAVEAADDTEDFTQRGLRRLQPQAQFEAGGSLQQPFAADSSQVCRREQENRVRLGRRWLLQRGFAKHVAVK